MKKILISLVLLATGFSLGLATCQEQNIIIQKSDAKVDKQAINFSQTQAGMDEQTYQKLKKTDDELNKVYSQVLKKHKDDKVFIAKLQKAELAWIKYRDAEIEAIYPEEDKMHNYGTIYPMCVNGILTEMTQQRIKELGLWLKGMQEGEVCAGSRGWE